MSREVTQSLEAEGWEFAGTVGVDGAHVLIADANYAERISQEWKELTRADYEGTVKNDVARLAFGYAGGVACVSGAGDGSYRVWVKRGDIPDDEYGPRITHIMIDFTENDYDS